MFGKIKNAFKKEDDNQRTRIWLNPGEKPEHYFILDKVGKLVGGIKMTENPDGIIFRGPNAPEPGEMQMFATFFDGNDKNMQVFGPIDTHNEQEMSYYWQKMAVSNHALFWLPAEGLQQAHDLIQRMHFE